MKKIFKLCILSLLFVNFASFADCSNGIRDSDIDYIYIEKQMEPNQLEIHRAYSFVHLRDGTKFRYSLILQENFFLEFSSRCLGTAVTHISQLRPDCRIYLSKLDETNNRFRTCYCTNESCRDG